MIPDGLLRVTSVKEEISHGDKSERIRLVHCDRFLELLGSLVILFLVQVDYAQLCQCLKIVWLSLQNFYVVGDGSTFVV